tara:strand:- start:156 stop:587 length:432 start_codon:yes stop_codon:yes gene_type:complete
VFALLVLSVGIFGVVAQEEEFKGKDDLRCLACGDNCEPADFVAIAMCLPPTNGEPICGVENGECVVLGYEGEVEDAIKESEDFEEELETGAGLTPDSVFYFLDGIIDSREEKIAEMREMAEACSEGDEGACCLHYFGRMEKVL